jgi:hypothetical protein
MQGTEIRIYFDTLQSQVVINLQSALANGNGYITKANLKTHMIDKAFAQLDTAYLQNKSFMNGLLNKILLTALTTNLKDALTCNDHTLIDAALRSYLGHLGGEELQPEWVSEIVDGLDIVQYGGLALNYVLDTTLQNIINTELPNLLNGITVDLSDLVTGDPLIGMMLPIYFGSETPSISVLFSAFNMDIATFTGSLNSSSIPDEYKAQIGDLFGSAINSFLVDENYTEDNITDLYWENEVITLSLSVNNNAYGTAERSGIYPKDSTTNITATPNNGYGFLRWEDGITDNPRTVTVMSDTVFTAIFDVLYTVNLSTNDNARGTVSPDSIYFRDSAAIITATANTGCRFLKWSDGVYGSPRTITVISDTNIMAIFDIMYSVNVSANDNARGTVTGNGSYAKDSTATIVATANNGHRFLKWSDGVTDSSRTITVISDTNIIAIFDVMHSVNVSANDNARGTVTGNGSYAKDSTATIEATANNGHRFLKWSDDITDNPRTITVLSDTNIMAIFDVMYTVNVSANDNARGTVTGSDIYPKDSMVTITATANTGYRFIRWSDGISENPRIITVTSDTNIIAEFEVMTAIVDIETSTISIYPNPATDNITVILPENVRRGVFTLYDLQSKMLIRQEIGNRDMISVSKLATGIYIYNVRTEKQTCQGKLIRK